MPKKTIEQRIDSLARMTQRGLTEVEKKLVNLDEKFSGRLQEVENRMATKAELRETEERLLDAIRGIEVRRRDFEALAGVVEELVRRVASLEKRR